MNVFCRIVVTIVCLLLPAVPVRAQDVLQQARALFQPIPDTPPVIQNNPATPEKIELGKLLFFDPRLSRSALISCNTCHNLGLGGADFQETSIGHGWQKGARNSPTVFNAVFNLAQFWDGRAADLKEQAKGPVQAAVEMNSDPARVVATLRSMPGYGERFAQAFPGQDDPITFDNMARAIEAFEATLLTPGSAFDRFLQGDVAAITKAETTGLATFIGKGCASCHAGVNMGGTGYFPFGVVARPEAAITAGDTGRFQLTGAESDQYVFKSPSLRNIAITAPYFHSGTVWDLREAVAIMGSAQLGISLTEADTAAIVAFLKTTTGTVPTVTYPVLPEPTATTPLPVLQ